MGQSKRCEVCGKLKPVEDFSKSYKNRCKECVASMARFKRDSCSEKKAEEYRKLMEAPDHLADDLLIDWEQRRYELAKEAMQGMVANWVEEKSDKSYATNLGYLCKMSIDIAESMIEILKSKKYDEQGIQDP